MIRRATLLLAVLSVLAAAAQAAAASAPKRVPFQRAVTLAEWGPTAYDRVHVKKRLTELKRRQHVDTVTILVVWMQKDANAVRVAPGSETQDAGRIRDAIRTAKRLRMRVVLRPYVDREDSGWRGYITPPSVGQWFASYGSFIRTYASIAQREGVDGFVVGTEMASLSGQSSYWRALVRGVRRRFRGWVTYQANWGGEETNGVQWWDALDAISISAYYPVAARPGMRVADLTQGWHDLIDEYGIQRRWFADIDGLRRRWHRPVMFGEIGYRTVPGTAVKPWSGDGDGNDVGAQGVAYQAALRTWYRLPWFRGMHWWYVTADDSLLDGRYGADHRPATSALRALRQWYAKRR